VSPTKRSHELIAEAAKLARDHIKRITKPLPESVHIDHLNQWVKFVEQSALLRGEGVP
jgi:hypothetical protein